MKVTNNRMKVTNNGIRVTNTGIVCWLFTEVKIRQILFMFWKKKINARSLPKIAHGQRDISRSCLTEKTPLTCRNNFFFFFLT